MNQGECVLVTVIMGGYVCFNPATHFVFYNNPISFNKLLRKASEKPAGKFRALDIHVNKVICMSLS